MADRILVVDDEAAIREITALMLRSAKYDCHEAANAFDALALLDSGKGFELILCKLMMPDLNGIGLLDRLKDKYPDVQFVVTTSAQDIAVALAAIRNGAYDYLLKPFDRAQCSIQLAAISHAGSRKRDER